MYGLMISLCCSLKCKWDSKRAFYSPGGCWSYEAGFNPSSPYPSLHLQPLQLFQIATVASVSFRGCFQSLGKVNFIVLQVTDLSHSCSLTHGFVFWKKVFDRCHLIKDMGVLCLYGCDLCPFEGRDCKCKCKKTKCRGNCIVRRLKMCEVRDIT
jgi:hypothetical protein